VSSSAPPQVHYKRPARSMGGPSSPSATWLHNQGLVNGIRLHWVESGRQRSENNSVANPLVILLHGFAEFWYSWRYQIVALSRAGYHVVAPDLRGYNLSEKATGGYDLVTLSQDVYELARRVLSNNVQKQSDNSSNVPKFSVLGHCWGGKIAWTLAARFPQSVQHVVVCNASHPLMRPPNSPLSERFWWYFFQVPLLPEFLLGCNHSWLVVQCWGPPSPTSATTATDGTSEELTGISSPLLNHDKKMTTQIFRDAMSQPHALRCMLAYYRQASSVAVHSNALNPILCPVLILSGDGQDPGDGSTDNHQHDENHDHDICIQNVVAGPCERIHMEGCDGRWLQQEAPELVNHHVLHFLQKYDGSRTPSPLLRPPHP
jgi:epoxide hydrolase 4